MHKTRGWLGQALSALRSRSNGRTVASGLATAAISAVLMLSSTGTAAAVMTDGDMRPGELWVYWGQDYNGAVVSSPPGNVWDWMRHTYYPNPWLADDRGVGQRVGNNNGSVANTSTRGEFTIYYDTGYRGARVSLPPYGQPGAFLAGWQQGKLLNDLRSSLWTCLVC